ncbi:hypothetical protein D9M72_403000 [compost metagenome]
MPTAASSRAIPPSDATASLRRRLPLADTAATSPAGESATAGSPDTVAEVEGTPDAVPDAAAVAEGDCFWSGPDSALAWVVSKVTVRSSAWRSAPETESARWLPAVRRRIVSARAAARACSEKEGSGGSGGCPGVSASPRLMTSNANDARMPYRK